MQQNWFPENILNCKRIKNLKSYAIVVLNRPIAAPRGIVESLWTNAVLRICVDGGTNRWLNWMKSHKLERTLKQPNLITGDLDSYHKESIDFFSESRVVRTLDQDETDFTKSLIVLDPYIAELNIENIIVLCDSSGRLDQIIANINTLHKNLAKPPETQRPVFILANNNLSWLLAKNVQHKIHIPDEVKSQWCALIPFEPTIITTKGLKWDLNNDVMKFGAMVSTSNTYGQDSSLVDVTSNNPVLWCMGIFNPTNKNDDS